MEEQKKKVIELMHQSQPIGKTPTSAVHIEGDGNQVAGGDIHNHINHREVVRPVITPPSGSITPKQAAAIKARIDHLVDIEATAGVADKGKLYAKWWGALRKRYQVASYREIPAALGDEAEKWLQQTAAQNRPKLRRSDNQKWRNEHYKAIFAKAGQLGMSKGEIHHLVHERLGKTVTSLKQLGERDLKKLYNIVMKLQARAQ